MRLDKLLSECGLASRTESKRAAKAGKITVSTIMTTKTGTIHIRRTESLLGRFIKELLSQLASTAKPKRS